MAYLDTSGYNRVMDQADVADAFHGGNRRRVSNAYATIGYFGPTLQQQQQHDVADPVYVGNRRRASNVFATNYFANQGFDYQPEPVKTPPPAAVLNRRRVSNVFATNYFTNHAVDSLLPEPVITPPPASVLNRRRVSNAFNYTLNQPQPTYNYGNTLDAPDPVHNVSRRRTSNAFNHATLNQPNSAAAYNAYNYGNTLDVPDPVHNVSRRRSPNVYNYTINQPSDAYDAIYGGRRRVSNAFATTNYYTSKPQVEQQVTTVPLHTYNKVVEQAEVKDVSNGVYSSTQDLADAEDKKKTYSNIVERADIADSLKSPATETYASTLQPKAETTAVTNNNVTTNGTGYNYSSYLYQPGEQVDYAAYGAGKRRRSNAHNNNNYNYSGTNYNYNLTMDQADIADALHGVRRSSNGYNRVVEEADIVDALQGKTTSFKAPVAAEVAVTNKPLTSILNSNYQYQLPYTVYPVEYISLEPKNQHNSHYYGNSNNYKPQQVNPNYSNYQQKSVYY